VKYDWYDPNNDVDGANVSAAHGHTTADIKFSTIGGGYLWYANQNIRLMLYYEHPMNESTSIAGYGDDFKDDVFTARLQFRF
jgi:phosphate-selective porin